MHKKWLKYSILAVLVLSAISLVLNIWMPFGQSFRIIFGSVYLLFLPGFAWSWIFWKSMELDAIERFTLSLVISIAFVPLTVFLLNKFGVKINLLNSILEIGALITFAIIVKFLNFRHFTSHH